MPVVRHIPLKLEPRNLMRRQGIKQHGRLRPEMKKLIDEMLALVDRDSLLEPTVVYEIYPIVEVRDKQVILSGGAVLKGTRPSKVLKDARELAVVVSTIGPALENRASEYFRLGEPVRGFLLDGIGSAAIDALYQETCARLLRQAEERGYQTGSRLSPGTAGFPISEQQTLFKLVPAGEIAVSLNPSGMMLPQKSASMVMGLGPKMATWTQAEACARCHLKKTCLHRVELD